MCDGLQNEKQLRCTGSQGSEAASGKANGLAALRPQGAALTGRAGGAPTVHETGTVPRAPSCH